MTCVCVCHTGVLCVVCGGVYTYGYCHANRFIVYIADRHLTDRHALHYTDVAMVTAPAVPAIAAASYPTRGIYSHVISRMLIAGVN